MFPRQLQIEGVKELLGDDVSQGHAAAVAVGLLGQAMYPNRLDKWRGRLLRASVHALTCSSGNNIQAVHRNVLRRVRHSAALQRTENPSQAGLSTRPTTCSNNANTTVLTLVYSVRVIFRFYTG